MGFCVRIFILFTLIIRASSSFGYDKSFEKCPVFFSTGNDEKWQVFRQLLSPLPLNRLNSDLKEIQADPLRVVVHKASQYSGRGSIVLVEDTSLDVEGTKNFGVNVKWHVHEIEKYIGRRAKWTVLLAYRLEDQVYVFKGTIQGTIVEKDGEVEGFTPYFKPDGHSQTLAAMNHKVSPRTEAVAAFHAGKPYSIRRAIDDWQGPYQ